MSSLDALDHPQPADDRLPGVVETLARELVGLVLERAERLLQERDSRSQAQGRVSPYLTAREAVAYLRLPTLKALYQLTERHAIPCLRRGHSLLFDVRDLDAWLIDPAYRIVPANVKARRARQSFVVHTHKVASR